MSERKPSTRPTIDDVASYAGVSIATVSRVINQTAPVATKTVERVQAAIENLNYQPQAAARTLAGRKTRTIGLLLPQIGGYFFFPMLQGIESGAHVDGYNLLIHSALSNPDPDQGEMPLALGEHNTDGLIVFAHSLSEKELRRLYDFGLPLVLLHQSPPEGLAIPNVTFENKDGARRIVEHLIEVHGYREIAILTGPEEHEDSYWREMGYLEALNAHGLVFNSALKLRGKFSPEIARLAVAGLLGTGVPLDAIFAADDESASGAMMALREAGLRIPEDVAVVGFDDTLLASHLTPPLTTVHAPIEQAGRVAISQLVRLINGEKTESVTLLPTELVIRKSCGCCSK
ncbi:MAG TPA: LacI family transcriptional regulator [Chloroflexi bacterium]|nr:LacI family transcriptional regulator [Chloroflexota bacterium]